MTRDKDFFYSLHDNKSDILRHLFSLDKLAFSYTACAMHLRFKNAAALLELEFATSSKYF